MNRPWTRRGYPCNACGEDGAFLVYAVHHDYTEWDREQEMWAQHSGPDAKRFAVCPTCAYIPTESEVESMFTNASENAASDYYEGRDHED